MSAAVDTCTQDESGQGTRTRTDDIASGELLACRFAIR
jgi:hypothetical protein